MDKLYSFSTAKIGKAFSLSIRRINEAKSIVDAKSDLLLRTFSRWLIDSKANLNNQKNEKKENECTTFKPGIWRKEES